LELAGIVNVHAVLVNESHPSAVKIARLESSRTTDPATNEVVHVLGDVEVELKQPKPFGPVTVTGLGPPAGIVNVKVNDAGALVVVVVVVVDGGGIDVVVTIVVVVVPCALWFTVRTVKLAVFSEFRTMRLHVRAGEPAGLT
jgi:hypothetical protein